MFNETIDSPATAQTVGLGGIPHVGCATARAAGAEVVSENASVSRVAAEKQALHEWSFITGTDS
jgi:hypothetical protein